VLDERAFDGLAVVFIRKTARESRFGEE